MTGTNREVLIRGVDLLAAGRSTNALRPVIGQQGPYPLESSEERQESAH